MPDDSDNSPAPAATRNAFDRQAEQSLADERLRHLAQEDSSHTGRNFLAALAMVRSKEPRLHAISEGRFEDDAALAATGQPDPLPHLRD